MNEHGMSGDHIVIGWANDGLQVFNYLSLSIGLAINAGIVASRYQHFAYLVRRVRPNRASWRAQCFLLLTFLSSLFFTWTAGCIQYGIGLSRSPATCSAALVLCTTAYTISKVTTNLFLLERLWIVSGCSRWQEARTWQAGMGLFLAGIPLLGAFLASYKSKMEGIMCHLGLRLWGTIGLIMWDAALNVFLSVVFALKCREAAVSRGSKLYTLAVRTLCVTCLSTVTSITNLTALTILKFELGSVCLDCYTLDVLVAALALSLLTNSKVDDEPKASIGQHNFRAPRSSIAKRPASTLHHSASPIQASSAGDADASAKLSLSKMLSSSPVIVNLETFQRAKTEEEALEMEQEKLNMRTEV